MMHLAFLFHKRYVWCPTTNAPFLHVDFGVPVTAKGWSEHKLVGSGDKDPTESLTASSISPGEKIVKGKKEKKTCVCVCVCA